MISEDQISFFWSKVQILGPNDCWFWQGARKPSGYGNLRINKEYRLAHRVAWEIANFEIPPGYQICHVCDKPPCCNPAHLMLGNTRSNYCDMIIKGRQGFSKNKAIGARNTNSKLTDEQVREIRDEYAKGHQNQYQLASKYGVSQPAIGSIVRFETWRHVA